MARLGCLLCLTVLLGTHLLSKRLQLQKFRSVVSKAHAQDKAAEKEKAAGAQLQASIAKVDKYVEAVQSVEAAKVGISMQNAFAAVEPEEAQKQDAAASTALMQAQATCERGDVVVLKGTSEMGRLKREFFHTGPIPTNPGVLVSVTHYGPSGSFWDVDLVAKTGEEEWPQAEIKKVDVTTMWRNKVYEVELRDKSVELGVVRWSVERKDGKPWKGGAVLGSDLKPVFSEPTALVEAARVVAQTNRQVDKHEASGRAEAKAQCRYIAEPMPASLEEMQNVNKTGMQESRLLDGQIIYTYPRDEDKFVSAELETNHNLDFEHSGERVNSICAEFNSVDGPADFLDVGANLGAYSIPMALCLKNRGHGGKVIAVEGLPNIAHHLEASVVANQLQDTVDVYNYAVSDAEMSADSVRMNLAPTNKGGSSILGNKPVGLVEGGDVQDGIVVDAKVTTLDSILHRDGRKPNIFAVKMDIEGSEGRALLGAQEFLSKSAPCLLQVELIKDWLNKAGTPVDSVLQLLRNYGFDTPTKIGDRGDYTFRQVDFAKCLLKFTK